MQGTLSTYLRLICSALAAMPAVSSLALSGCASWMRSSLEYTRGTEALEAGNYEEAIRYLEQAVQLDPTMSRNHNNLASAYGAVGRVRDGWPHVRQAVILSPRNQQARANFNQFFRRMRELTKLEEGDTTDEVQAKFGSPDSVNQTGDRLQWQYGLTALEFRNGQLIGAADMVVQ